MNPQPVSADGSLWSFVANREHLEILEKTAHEWNAWRRGHPRIRPDLRAARLTEADLHGYNLQGADLRGASLLAANLGRADMRGADLSECDLRFCEWRGARLNGAKLRDAIGVEEGMRAASQRRSWRVPVPRARTLQTVAVAAGLVLAWVLADRGLAYLESRPAPTPPPPAIEAAIAVSEHRLTAWSVEAVAISQGLMRLRLNVDEVDEQAYLEGLQAACRALEGRLVHPPIMRIEVLRQDGHAGWAFEEAGRCPEALRTPSARLAVTIAAASRPLSPGPRSTASR